MKKFVQIFGAILCVAAIIFCANTVADNKKEYARAKAAYEELLPENEAAETELSELKRASEIIDSLVVLYHSIDGTKTEEIRSSESLLDELQDLQYALNQKNSDYDFLKEAAESLTDWRESTLSYNEELLSPPKKNLLPEPLTESTLQALKESYQLTENANYAGYFGAVKDMLAIYISYAETSYQNAHEKLENGEKLMNDAEHSYALEPVFLTAIFVAGLLLIADIIWIARRYITVTIKRKGKNNHIQHHE